MGLRSSREVLLPDDEPRVFGAPTRPLKVSPLLRMLVVCPDVCCGRSSRRTTAVGLRRARDSCVRLQREALLLGDRSDAPVEHLRAAAQHLAVVEQWLVNKAKGDAGGRVDALEAPKRAERLARELGLDGGLDQDEDEIRFLEQFSPLASAEVLLTVVPCVIKSHSFLHPGKLYMSSDRLCFYSCVMGVQVSCAVAWGDISQVRLSAAETTRTHPVRVSLKRPQEFDGDDVEKIDIRVFDLADLTHLHRCATFFLGTGLFGPIDDSSPHSAMGEDSPVKQQQRSILQMMTTSGPELMRTPSRAVQDLVDHLESQAAVWQLQRRTSVFHTDWRAPFLPHDGAKQTQWVALEDSYVAHPFIPARLDRSVAALCDRPPIPEIEVLGQKRPCKWNVVADEGADDEGWQYAIDFYISREYWGKSCGSFSHVRRRRWRPTFAVDSPDPSPLPTLLEPGLEPAEQASDAFAFQRARTTMLAEKGLAGTKAGTLPIVDEDLGFLPLAKLAQALESEDWSTEGSLMQRYFEEIGAWDLEIGPWAAGHGAAAKVKGKVRSLEMRLKVPPQPMCPKETRCSATWHVLTSLDKIVVESATMSLDVPCGTSFRIVACDTFMVAGDGSTRMVRTWGVEWVKSSWMRSLVEASVPAELERSALQLVKALRSDW